MAEEAHVTVGRFGARPSLASLRERWVLVLTNSTGQRGDATTAKLSVTQILTSGARPEEGETNVAAPDSQVGAILPKQTAVFPRGPPRFTSLLKNGSRSSDVNWRDEPALRNFWRHICGR